MHLGGLLSTQEARVDSNASFVLSNLPRAPITPWLRAAHLPFLKILSCKCKLSYSQTPLILKLKGSKKESLFTGCP